MYISVLTTQTEFSNNLLKYVYTEKSEKNHVCTA